MSDTKELLKKLVAFPTVTSNLGANKQALDFIDHFLQERGMRVKRFESNGFGSLVATTHPTKTPKVMLAGHIDVVPAPVDFFNMREVDGKLFGRGVLDMKFAIASYLQLVDELQNDLSTYDFGIMITTDEEIGGQNGTAMLIEKGYLPQVCVIPDGGNNWQIQVHAKGHLYLTISKFGKPAHGSQPWLGENAIDALMATLHDIQKLFTSTEPTSNTLSITLIKGGKAINQVADYAEAGLDIRIMSQEVKQQLIQQIEQICQQHGAELTINLNGHVASFSLDNPYIQRFAQLITEVTGTTVTGSHTLGTNDARFFAEHNVPCISIYPTGGHHHGPEEWIEAIALEQFREIVGKYLKEVALVERRTATSQVLTPTQ